jgi:hypothetical protein
MDRTPGWRIQQWPFAAQAMVGAAIADSAPITEPHMPLVVRMIKRQFETDVSTLKDILEAAA